MCWITHAKGLTPSPLHSTREAMQNGFVERFNGRRCECLNENLFVELSWPARSSKKGESIRTPADRSQKARF